MPVRLTRAYGGQAANSLYWGADQATLRSVGIADDDIESASDYAQQARTVTEATANASRNALIYRMNSGSAQVLNIPQSGFWPVGTVLTVAQMGAGATTVTPASGVTINTKLSSLATGGQRSVGQLIKDGPNTWTAVGGFGG